MPRPTLDTPDTPDGPTTVEQVWSKIRAAWATIPTPPPVTDPGTSRRTRIWCGNCGCYLLLTPGAGYECRVCEWTGDAY